MKKLLLGLPFVVGLSVGLPSCPGLVVLRAQVPATLTATWNPNPVSDAVVSYKIAVDAVTPTVVPVSACTASLCTTTITVLSFGAHTVTLRASNLRISGNPASLQDGPAATLNFTLNQSPQAAPGGLALQ